MSGRETRGLEPIARRPAARAKELLTGQLYGDSDGRLEQMTREWITELRAAWEETLDAPALAGGGLQGGITHGATDDLGYNAVQDRVHINDLHATLLHLLGIDHERLTHRFQGRDFRLPDIAGSVVTPILA